MSEILFVTWDGGGNVPPALGVARELAARGHRVRLLGHAAQADALASSGHEVVPVRHARKFSALAPSSPLEMMRTFADPGMGRDLLAAVAARPADLVIVDCLMFGALEAAARAGLRYAVLEHLYDGYYQRGCLGGPLGAYLWLRGQRPRQALARAALRLVTTLPELDPVADPPANLRQVGPVMAPVGRAARRADEAPTILVSLSTFGFDGMADALARIVAATHGLGARVVVTTGPALSPEAFAAPGVEVHRYVPHAELMPQASLFVGHGGHGSTMQALAHDLPVLLMPMSGLADQPWVARSVLSAGAGRMVKKSARPAALAEHLRALLGDGPHRAAAARLGAALRARRGAEAAADAIDAALARPAVQAA